MFFIVFGWDKRGVKNYGSAAIVKCSGCFETGEWSLQEVYDYAHIFFIPITKYNNRYFLICNNCGRNSFEIYDDQVKVAKKTAKAFKSFGKGKISQNDLYHIIEKNKELRNIEAPDDSWECPECTYSNLNSTYKCKQCGYSIM